MDGPDLQGLEEGDGGIIWVRLRFLKLECVRMVGKRV
jgi:hypothetical protein